MPKARKRKGGKRRKPVTGIPSLEKWLAPPQKLKAKPRRRTPTMAQELAGTSASMWGQVERHIQRMESAAKTSSARIKHFKPKPLGKPEIPSSKLRKFYKIQTYVTAGGKPRTSHPYFTTMGGLLGSTGARTRTKIKLSDELSWSDRRELTESLERMGFEKKWNPRTSARWGGVYFEKIDYEQLSVKATTKEEKKRIKEGWMEYHRGRFEPYVEIAVKYGEYEK